MKVWLDDLRPAPDGWLRVKTVNHAINLLQTNKVTEISLDHDLGYADKKTGYDVMLWIEEQVIKNNFTAPKIRIHTANSSAREKMKLARQSIEKRSK